MPQSNITYDLQYNRKLVELLKEMDEKHWRKAGDAYAPTMFSEKLGNFHGAKIGGGSPANQKYIQSGNSPAYPPINMNSGLAVHSGGAYAGIDGAVGGYSFNNFLGDVAGVGKEVAPELIKAYMMGSGQNAVGGYSFNDFLGDVGNVGKQVAPFAPLLMGLGRKKRGGSKVGDTLAGFAKTIAPFAPLLLGLGNKKRGGSKIGDTLAGFAKTIAPFAPLLLGLGRPAPRKKLDVIQGLLHLGAKPSHSYKKLHEMLTPYRMKGGAYSVDKFIGDFNKIGSLIKPVAQPIISALTDKAVGKIKGGYGFNDFIGDVAHVGKSVAPDLIRAYAMGAGRKGKKGGVRSGGDDLSSMVEMVKPMDMVYSKGKGKKGGLSLGDALNSAKSVGKSIINNPVVREVANDLLRQGLNTGKDAVVKYAKEKLGAGRGKSVRAELVKKIMKERGVKMIEASKIVKAEGLY